ncbi:MAG: type I 3-dehydroquinate dehydratase [Candidatus Micrarchaeales archaeon]
MKGTRKLCATMMPSNIAQLERMVDYATAKNADFKELRLDRLSPSGMEKAPERISNQMDKTVLTLRSQEEGGKYAGSDSEMKAILSKLAQYNPMLLDIEYRFAFRNKNFVKKLRENDVRMIVSYHNFETTPSRRVLRDLLEEMNKIGDVVKIVTMAQEPIDNFRIFGLYESNPTRKDILAFAMGDYGMLSRILSITHYNAPFAYCSLGKPIAPGMMSIERMKKVLSATP